MNCHEAAMRVPAYCDGELDALESVAVERHLVACPACAEQHAALLDLRSRVRSAAPRYPAPASLRQRVAQLANESSRVPRPADRWRWLATGVAIGCAASVLAWFVASESLLKIERDSMSRLVVASHVRATLSDHLLAVVSTDQHTVKPWLSARLDFSPPVRDLAAAGFPLQGARIESLDGQAAAALVYRHRDHMIDVFVRPESGNDATPALRAVRGFNVAHLRRADMGLWAVSDLNAEELAKFVEQLAGND